MPAQITVFIIYLVLTIQAQEFAIPNVNATFSEDVLPFQIYVDPGFIEDTRQQVANTRLPTNTESFPYSDGAIIQNATAVRDVWVKDYNWEAVQASINANLKQYTTVVRANGSNYTEPVPLHFVHHRSPRSDAIPLLFIHSWPGSFLEVGNIINLLVDPPNDTLPAFHVIAPSIPGFGFSPAPIAPGCGPIATVHSFNALMHKLGYARYVAEGGDYGGILMRYQAAFYPDSLITFLDAFYIIQPNSTDLARFAANQTTPEEITYINSISGFDEYRSGYRFVQETEPLSLAYAMTDSPLGLAMWIYQAIRDGVDWTIPTTPGRFDAAEVVTWTLMYWIQGPYGSFRFYKEGRTDGDWSGLSGYAFGDLPYVTQPIAITQTPYDLGVGMPLDWAQRQGNVQVRYTHDKGGHFGAFEVPELIAGDIWAWFGNRELSGTKIFYE